MNAETVRKKTQLKAEIERLEEQRAAAETELQTLESETAPKIYRRSYWDTLSPARQNDVVTEIQAGKAQLID